MLDVENFSTRQPDSPTRRGPNLNPSACAPTPCRIGYLGSRAGSASTAAAETNLIAAACLLAVAAGRTGEKKRGRPHLPDGPRSRAGWPEESCGAGFRPAEGRREPGKRAGAHGLCRALGWVGARAASGPNRKGRGTGWNGPKVRIKYRGKARRGLTELLVCFFNLF